MTTSSLEHVKPVKSPPLPDLRAVSISIASGKAPGSATSTAKEYVESAHFRIAVTSLGHCNEELAEVIEKQARKLIHVSNLSITRKSSLNSPRNCCPSAT